MSNRDFPPLKTWSVAKGIVAYRRVAPQIQGIRDETHSQIHAEPTDHQKELEKAMQQREHADGKSPQTFASVTSTFLHLPFFGSPQLSSLSQL